jgi:putative toxin-antitoxin system antitoxin component (TIGR02293 family)
MSAVLRPILDYLHARWRRSLLFHHVIQGDGETFMTSAVARKLDSIKQRTSIPASSIAEMIGATPQTLSRWATGKNDPQREHLDRLLEFDYLTERLAEFFAPEDARLWLFAPHPQLNGERPADLVAKGRQKEVLAVIARLQDSAFV